MTLLLTILLFAATALAQMEGFSKEQLIHYTPLNPYGRSPDGRPHVPDFWIKQLGIADSTSAHEVLSEAGFPNQWEGGWQIPHPGKKLIGRAFTAQFMPSRPDLEEIIEADAAAAGLTKPTTHRVIEMLGPGDVLVVDVMGRIEEGQFGGDNLIFSLFMASGNGFIVNGSFRDLDGVYPMKVPVYSRGFHPSVRGNAILTGVNVPLRIGNATVMPGDVVLGDNMGVTFIPPQWVRKVIEHAETKHLRHLWFRHKLVSTPGRHAPLDLLPVPKDPTLRKEYEEWMDRKKTNFGLP